MRRGRMREFRDQDLKPNKDDEERILGIIASPLGKPTTDQLELLWHFRYYLRKNKKALTKVTDWLPALRASVDAHPWGDDVRVFCDY